MLKVKQVSINGAPAPLPTRVPIDGSRLSVSMQLLQQADEYIQATTSTFDPSLGRGGSDRSGRAVMALQQQSDAGTSHYLENLASISMTYEAKVVLDLIPAVYDRPGRVVQLISGEDDSSAALINLPFFIDPETKEPRPIPIGGIPPNPIGLMPPQAPQAGGVPGGPPMGGGMLPPGPMPMGTPKQMIPTTPKEQFHELQKGVYGVAVSVGRSFQTRLTEGAADMGQLLQANPALLPLIGPLYFKYRDFPGSKEISELMKKEQKHIMPYLFDDDGTNVEALTAQIQQMGEQGQQMQAELAKASEYIKTEQAKWAAQVAIAQGKAELQVQLQGMDDETKITVARINAVTKSGVTTQKGMQEQIVLETKQRHAQEMGAAHILSGQHTQAMKAAQAKELEVLKVEGEVTRDAIRAEIDVEKDRATQESPDVTIDVDVPGPE
jgi:hypothetical protein